MASPYDECAPQTHPLYVYRLDSTDGASASTFMSILMKHDTELDFLNTIFSFLQRRTKYFHPENTDAPANFQSLINVLQHQKASVRIIAC